VTRAMEALAEAGLIVRRKRAGSFVAQPRVQSAILDIPDIQADVTARGKSYGYRPLARSRTEEELEIDCLHLADGRPFALEHRLITLIAVPEAAYADFSTMPPGPWLIGHVPWTEAEHRISAAPADTRAASLLGIDRHAACLVLERRTWRGDVHITRVRQTF